MKMTSKITVLTLALLAAGSMTFAQGTGKSNEKGDEIMRIVRDFKKPDFSTSNVIMTLTDKNGKKETRAVREYGRDKDGQSSVVMMFLSPASVKDTRFLQIEKENADDDKFIYLPSLKSTRRVNASEGSKSFMGTDATYDDLSTREFDEDYHEYITTEDKNGYKNCDVVIMTPKDKKSSQYSYRKAWIYHVDEAEKIYYPVYTELYDKNNKLVKKLTVSRIEKVGDFYIPMDDKMENVQTGHSTTLEIKNVDTTTKIPDRYFTQNFLNTGK
ncbi:cupin superfamily acireductone dioxygenase involved in methionine salvage [Treponema rectale]|jgi:cupin superfamily acireductone dioxygenase involved in methionine salvage|uniref:Cupin superfamily acireductone dioxygenase involved in methionine salvage n=1 Tax=Treponema rectale TaxID=744512 RepID=A0A840SJY3_9SPIR|nr:outer membrane lipoprotein-sorting protein [Treponema rectale]MBB5219773.1 cupin superfamily acireductone dioxygenase involved in methionine salvage [Treponema rectale]